MAPDATRTGDEEPCARCVPGRCVHGEASESMAATDEAFFLGPDAPHDAVLAAYLRRLWDGAPPRDEPAQPAWRLQPLEPKGAAIFALAESAPRRATARRSESMSCERLARNGERRQRNAIAFGAATRSVGWTR
jgi:hypothetical protein